MKKIYHEFLILYILLPISFCFTFPIGIKMTLGGVGFIYIIYTLIKKKYAFFKKGFENFSKEYAFKVFVNLMGLIIISTLYLWFTNKELLFNVVKSKPTMWITFIGVYSFLSVIPQEIVYRSFYFERYKEIFKNEKWLHLSNAFIFSLGHIFFQNILVLVITFIGGLIFSYSYSKTKSLVLISIEHAIYGCWLYTVGFGEILGFPTP